MASTARIILELLRQPFASTLGRLVRLGIHPKSVIYPTLADPAAKHQQYLKALQQYQTNTQQDPSHPQANAPLMQGTWEKVTYCHHGDTLRGYQYTPPNYHPEAGLVAVFHGNASTHTPEALWRQAEIARRLGKQLICYHNPGVLCSEGITLSARDLVQPHAAWIRDAIDKHRKENAQITIPDHKYLLIGMSLGAAQAVATTAALHQGTNPIKVKAFSWNSFASLSKLATKVAFGLSGDGWLGFIVRWLIVVPLLWLAGWNLEFQADAERLYRDGYLQFGHVNDDKLITEDVSLTHALAPTRETLQQQCDGQKATPSVSTLQQINNHQYVGRYGHNSSLLHSYRCDQPGLLPEAPQPDTNLPPSLAWLNYNAEWDEFEQKVAAHQVPAFDTVTTFDKLSPAAWQCALQARHNHTTTADAASPSATVATTPPPLPVV